VKLRADVYRGGMPMDYCNLRRAAGAP